MRHQNYFGVVDNYLIDDAFSIQVKVLTKCIPAFLALFFSLLIIANKSHFSLVCFVQNTLAMARLLLQK